MFKRRLFAIVAAGETPPDSRRDGGAAIVAPEVDLFFGRGGLDMGAGDSIVPAQFVLVDEAPEEAEPGGKGGKKGREHAPAARASIERGAVEGSQAEVGGAQAGS